VATGWPGSPSVGRVPRNPGCAVLPHQVPLGWPGGGRDEAAESGASAAHLGDIRTSPRRMVTLRDARPRVAASARKEY
jgi:hypothetical protein